MLIYKITNIITGDFYIGQTTKTLQRRFSVHKCNARFGIVTHLCSAIRKYGEDKFSAEILESQVPVMLLDVAEQNWIKLLKPQYNETMGGKCNRLMTEKHSDAMKEYHAKKPRSEYATYGMLGKRMPYESRVKSAKAKWKPCIVKGKQFQSILEACAYYEIGRTTFHRWRDKGLVEMM